MMFHDLFVKSYSHLRNNGVIPLFLIRLFRWSIRSLSSCLVRIFFQLTTPPCCEEKSRVVVSLTSFPERIGVVWITVQSLLRQTYKSKEVILYLSKAQFSSVEDLPKRLLSLRKKGLSIVFVDGDIRSHKKYLYSFVEYQDSLVFLADDDIIYPSDMLEKSLYFYDENSGAVVIARYGREMKYSKDGALKPYLKWEGSMSWKVGAVKKQPNLFFGSGGGTLLDPKRLYKDVCNISIAEELCPYADDIWLNAQCNLSHYQIMIVNAGLLLPIVIKNDKRLSECNNGPDSFNDIQIKNVIDFYLEKKGVNPFAKKNTIDID